MIINNCLDEISRLHFVSLEMTGGNQIFRYLNRIRRRTFSNIIAYNPEIESVCYAVVAPHSSHKHLVAVVSHNRCRVEVFTWIVGHNHAWSVLQNPSNLLNFVGLRKFHIHRFGMAAVDRHTRYCG